MSAETTPRTRCPGCGQTVDLTQDGYGQWRYYIHKTNPHSANDCPRSGQPYRPARPPAMTLDEASSGWESTVPRPGQAGMTELPGVKIVVEPRTGWKCRMFRTPTSPVEASNVYRPNRFRRFFQWLLLGWVYLEDK